VSEQRWQDPRRIRSPEGPEALRRRLSVEKQSCERPGTGWATGQGTHLVLELQHSLLVLGEPPHPRPRQSSRLARGRGGRQHGPVQQHGGGHGLGRAESAPGGPAPQTRVFPNKPGFIPGARIFTFAPHMTYILYIHYVRSLKWDICVTYIYVYTILSVCNLQRCLGIDEMSCTNTHLINLLWSR
jgi:hypothetical protein